MQQGQQWLTLYELLSFKIEDPTYVKLAYLYIEILKYFVSKGLHRYVAGVCHCQANDEPLEVRTMLLTCLYLSNFLFADRI